jgi:pyrroloquinoline quinone (PQQ) biosynthesis protein C
MSPPLTQTKIDELQQFLPGVTTADIDYIKDRLKKWTSSSGEVASDVIKYVKDRLRKRTSNAEVARDIDLFTFDEFRIFLDRIARSSTSLRAAFEAMTEEQFAKLVKTWASSYIALSDPGAKKEFIDDKQASRIQ